MSRVLSRRQDRWGGILSLFDFVIKPQDVNNNPVDGPTGWPEYEIGYDTMTAKILPTLAATTITESYGDIIPRIMTTQETDFWASKIHSTMVNDSTADESQWR